MQYMEINLLRKSKKTMSKNAQNQEAKKAMSEALAQYLKNKNSVKDFSLCMKETTAWLQAKAK